MRRRLSRNVYWDESAHDVRNKSHRTFWRMSAVDQLLQILANNLAAIKSYVSLSNANQDPPVNIVAYNVVLNPAGSGAYDLVRVQNDTKTGQGHDQRSIVGSRSSLRALAKSLRVQPSDCSRST